MATSATSFAAKLHVNGRLPPRTFALTQDRVNVGRDETNLIRLDDSSVSLHHALLVRTAGHYKVRDLISTNGTYVNGERTLGAELHNGDRLRIGSVEMRYEELPNDGGVKIESTEPAEDLLPLGRARTRRSSTRTLRRVRWTLLVVVAAAGGIAWRLDTWPFGAGDPLRQFSRNLEARVVADPLYGAVNTAEDGKDYAKLLTDAKLLAERHPHSALANYILGAAYGKLNYFVDAAAAFREAIKVQPDYTNAWYNLGWAYARAGQFSAAAGAYRQLTKLAPRDARAWIELGDAEAGAGRQTEAVAAYNAVIKLKPDSADGYFHLGAALANQGNTTEAVDAFRQALRRDPNLPEAWFNLGVMSEKRGENDEAVVFFQQAIRLKPDYVEAWGGLVKSHLNLRQLEKAGEAAREMKRLDPAKAEQLADELSREAPPAQD